MITTKMKTVLVRVVNETDDLIADVWRTPWSSGQFWFIRYQKEIYRLIVCNTQLPATKDLSRVFIRLGEFGFTKAGLK